MGLQVSDLVGGSESGDGLDATRQGTCDIQICSTNYAMMMISRQSTLMHSSSYICYGYQTLNCLI